MNTRLKSCHVEPKNDLYFEEIGHCFEKWASSYDEFRRATVILNLLPPNSANLTCLEVGCGYGAISKSLRKVVKTLTVCDISAKLAEKTGARLGVEWLQEDACSLGIEDGAYDLVVSSECIEHTSSPARAIRELARVTGRGGTTVITSPNKLWYPILSLAQSMKCRKFSGKENWLFPWQAKHLLLSSGESAIKLRGCHLFPWQIPGAKRVLPNLEKKLQCLSGIMINYAIAGKRA